MPIQIVSHAPLWIWPLFVILIVAGLAQSRTRRVSRPLVLVLPAVMIPLSLYGIASSFGPDPIAFGAWLFGAGASFAFNEYVLQSPRGVRYDTVINRFEIPGSFVPMVLIVTTFAARFVIGAVERRDPILAAGADFIGGVCLFLGFASGFFLTRSLRVLRAEGGGDSLQGPERSDRLSAGNAASR